MKVTAILVTYNSHHVISRSLSSIYSNPDIAQIIVVDNASDDGTIELIEKDFAKVKVIRNSENLGYAFSCNLGLEQVETEYALLLNPDAIIEDSAVSDLMKVLERYPDVAIAAPLLKNRGLDESSDSLRSPAVGKVEKAQLLPEDNNIYQSYFISGAIALWNIRLMKEVGFFDDSFFMFYEDDDLSLRVKKKGYRMLLMKGLKAYHSVGNSTFYTQEIENLKLKSSVWSRLYIEKKYNGFLISKIKALFNLVGLFFDIIFQKLKEKIFFESDLTETYSKLDEIWREAQITEERLILESNMVNDILIEEALKKNQKNKESLIAEIQANREQTIIKQDDILKKLSTPKQKIGRLQIIRKANWEFLLNSRTFYRTSDINK